MMIHLLTRDGRKVGTVKMPIPFQVLPDALVWGSRLFVIREEFTVCEAPAFLEPVYHEVYAFYLPADFVTVGSEN